jgi:hypothetical protein
VLPIIGQFFPRFRLADIDAGHWLISEQPEAFRQGNLHYESYYQNDWLTDIFAAVVNFLQDS